MTVWDGQITEAQEDDERESLAQWEERELRRELWLAEPRSHWLLAIALGMLSFQVLGLV
jgi:hypothetical protein